MATIPHPSLVMEKESLCETAEVLFCIPIASVHSLGFPTVAMSAMSLLTGHDLFIRFQLLRFHYYPQTPRLGLKYKRI